MDTIQNRRMLDDFIEAKRDGICGIMGDRYVINNSNVTKDDQRLKAEYDRKSVSYIDANNLYERLMIHKLLSKDFDFTTTTSRDVFLNTNDGSDHGYYIVCDNGHSDI